MKPSLLIRSFAGFTTLMLLLAGCSGNSNDPKDLFRPIGFSYPQPFSDTLFSDTLHGVATPDPFRWMEAEEAPILHEWIEQENQLTADYIGKIPFRKAVEQRVRDLWDSERFHGFRKQGDYLYFFRNSGLQNQDLLARQSLSGGEEEVVLDPNQLSKDGYVSLGQIAFSADSRYLAYETCENGSDWRTIFIRDLQENRDLTDTLRWVRYSRIAWTGNGFFYSRYPAPLRGEKTSTPMEFHQVFFHEVGKPQSSDRLIFADRARSKRGFHTQTSPDGRFLILNIWETNSGNGVYVMDLLKGTGESIPVVDDIANDFDFVGSANEHLFFLTNFEAPNRKLIKVSIQKPDPGYWEVVIPETPDLLQEVYFAGGKLVAQYLRDAQNFLQVYETDGTQSTILTMQEAGTISQFEGNLEEDRAFFTFESFLTPPTVYELDLNLLTARIYKAPKVNFNASTYETRLVFIKNQGQPDLPLFITLKKGTRLDGNRPTLLLGDGSFGHCTTPRFDPAYLSLLENSGVLAQAVVRGGGEYGRNWYEGGVRSKKQRTFDDFQAAAGYLISQGYTRKEKLAIRGTGGAGGLLTGASLAQRPDLFRVAIAESGIYDLIRYPQFTIGSAWAYDFGRPEEPKEFDILKALSPIHNILPAEYPATLLLAGDHDDRVYPAHSFKFAAGLQSLQQGPLPVLFMSREHSGNGTGTPVSQAIRESADWLSFLYFHLQQPVVYEL